LDQETQEAARTINRQSAIRDDDILSVIALVVGVNDGIIGKNDGRTCGGVKCAEQGGRASAQQSFCPHKSIKVLSRFSLTDNSKSRVKCEGYFSLDAAERPA